MDAVRPPAAAWDATAAKTSRSAYRAAAAIVMAGAIATLLLLIVADLPGPVIPGISAFFAAGVFVTELATAFLLFVRLRDHRTWPMLLLGSAYLYSSLMAVPYLLAFPGALLRDRSVIGGPQSIAWIFVLWIFGFALLTLTATVLEAGKAPPFAAEKVTSRMRAAVACAAVAVAAVVALALGAADRLPAQIGPHGWTLWDVAFSWLTTAMLLAGVLIILLIIRDRSEVFLWVALALTAMFCGSLLSTYGGGRFTIGWSLSRLLWVFSGCALFLYFMGQFVRQQRLLARSHEALEARVGERTAELTSTIAQRDLLLREVHHRVKNNFQVINSLISFESSHAGNDETRETLRNLHGRVYALGLVHQRLMQSSNLSTFDIGAFLDDLCGNLASLSAADMRGIRLTAEADPLQTDLDFAGPLGLLVTELVTAALARFGEGKSGEIRVTLRRAPDARVALKVSDDAPPAQDEPGQSRIVRALVGQVRGELASAHESGTAVTVMLPAPDA